MIDGDLCHDLLLKSIKQELAFDKNANYEEWREKLKSKFEELFGIDEIKKNDCEHKITIEEEVQKEGYRQIRFTFESEVGAIVPCYILIPDGEKKKYPLAITMQGHSTGFHNSIGVVKYDEDEEYMPRGAFAVQAVQNGYVALAIEQRGMGERRPTKDNRKWALMCTFTALRAMSLGRTILGERIWDISKAIDLISYFPEVDTDNIVITGNSGGGTISFYASCYDERIKYSVPSCAFCGYEESILDMYHCSCNYVQDMYKWFEMGDLSALIAPRKLTVIAGKEDNIFPIKGVERQFEKVKDIYEKAGAKDNCKLIETPKGHWWCVDIVWEEINRLMK